MEKNSAKNEPVYFNFRVFLSIVLLISIFILLKILNLLTITEKMLYYFFSASAQSMAAMFAVVGVFAVFRFQAQENKLRNLYDVFKLWFKSWENLLAILCGRKIQGGRWYSQPDDVNIYEREWNPSIWRDDEFVEMMKKLLNQIQKDKVKSDMANDWRKRIEEIEKHEKRRNDILESMKIPMLAILISFMLSTVSLALTVTLSNSIVGFVILIVLLAMIAFSVISVCKYIRFCISLVR